MNNKSLHFNSYITIFLNEIGEFIFNMLVFVSKPIVQFIYKKYRSYKRNKNQAKKSTLRNIIITATVCILGISIAFGAGIFVKNVSAQDNDILHKYYTSVTVQPGDSLWSIAEENYVLGYDSPTDYIEEVMHINHLDDENEIISGSSLVIPYYSEEIK